MKFELIDELKYENSDCCDALPHTEVYDGIGLCSKCKEWAVFGGFMAQDSKWSKNNLVYLDNGQVDFKERKKS